MQSAMFEIPASCAHDEMLLHAMRYGSIERVRDLLRHETPHSLAQASDSNGRNALMLSIIYGRVDLALELAGVGVSSVDFGGWNALMYATRHGQIKIVHSLIVAGANVAHATESGMTALSVACRRGRVECARALIDAGANAEHAARDGSTALMHASRAGHVSCIRSLLDDAGAPVEQADSSGQAALAYASASGRVDSVLALVGAGADVACREYTLGWTALFHACRFGRLACARALIAAGADVSVEAHDAATALRVATQCGELECARALLDAGATSTPSVIEAVHLAPSHKQLDMLALLCAYATSRRAASRALKRVGASSLLCANWLASTKRWTTPLHHLEFLSTARVRALLRSGADVLASDRKADAPTPIGVAIQLLARDPKDERAALVSLAAGPWSPCAHTLFPDAARSRAVELALVGARLARVVERSCGDATDAEMAFRDVWLAHVMPHAIDRASK